MIFKIYGMVGAGTLHIWSTLPVESIFGDGLEKNVAFSKQLKGRSYMAALLSRVSLILLFVVSLSLYGCDYFVPRAEYNSLSDQMSKLTDQVSKMASQLEKLQTNTDQMQTVSVEVTDLLTNLKTELGEIKFGVGQYRSAIFEQVTDQGFQRLDSNVGTLVVSIRDIKPYADGVRVTLNVGNLTTAEISGITYSVKWGQSKPSYKDKEWGNKLAAWVMALQEKTHSFPHTLKPGLWNVVQIALPGTQPQKFGYLELSMEAKTIALPQGRKSEQ
jgi:hypothetical protein